MPMIAISEITAYRLKKMDSEIALDERSINGKHYIYVTEDIMAWLSRQALTNKTSLEQSINKLINDYRKITENRP